MIYDGKKSLLLSTGLNLEEIADVLKSKNLEEGLSHKGEKFLDRYQTFKKYNELISEEKLKTPILPIIGALPCIGKTTISREVATSFGIGIVMGGDAFRAALREFISQEKHPEFFSSVYQSWKFFGEENSENILKGFEFQAKLLNQAMERIVVDRGIRDGESIVAEYLHFLPSQYSPAVLSHPSIIPIILKLDSEEEWKRRIAVRDKMTHLKGQSSRLLDVLDRYKLMQEFQIKDAQKHGVPVVANDDWNKGKDKVLDIIFERIKKLNKMAEDGVKIDDKAIIEKIEQERAKFNK